MADLEGVRFIDVPWLVTPDLPTLAKLPRRDTGNVLLDRLYALGLDACRVALGVRARMLDGRLERFEQVALMPQVVERANGA